MNRACESAIFGISGLRGSDVFFVPVTHGQQHFLGEIKIAALFAVVFKNLGFDNGIGWAAFLAETAEDAFGQINVIARGAARAIFPPGGLDSDGHRRTDSLAQFAGNAAFLAIFVTAQGMQAAKTR